MTSSRLRVEPYRTKRFLDVAVVAAVAPVAVPLAAGCAVAVYLDSGGPVLFRQVRVGRDGSEFEVLKFRTMVTGDNPLVPDPSRITRVGRWLRRFSLDELPQLWNVARGDMSVIGPRPTVRSQVERYTAFQRRRLEVRPGLTGWAQVNGRNALAWARRIELDVEYVDSCSLGGDLAILGRTLLVLLSGDGVEGHDADDPLIAQAVEVA